MSYYKRLDGSGAVLQLLTYDNIVPIIHDPLVVEITEEEYNALLDEIKAANQPEAPDPDEISAEEALDIILGVST